MGFLSRLLVPRGVRRAAHPMRTVKRAATPRAVKRAQRLASPIDNAVYSLERSVSTVIRHPVPTARKKKGRAASQTTRVDTSWIATTVQKTVTAMSLIDVQIEARGEASGNHPVANMFAGLSTVEQEALLAALEEHKHVIKEKLDRQVVETISNAGPEDRQVLVGKLADRTLDVSVGARYEAIVLLENLLGDRYVPLELRDERARTETEFFST
jgi:hypothetical protein